MKAQKENQLGITLIALVISIIVMLILAGVSLNMTIGDNGIIKQAQSATILQSCALLEEFLQQQYVTLYDALEESYPNKLDYLISDIGKCQNYFQKAQNGKFYFIGTTNGCSYYLINKDNLPSDIKNSLVGGNEVLTNTIWADFSDVYGVTTDLKVYYCGGDNAESRVGAVDEELVADLDETIAGLGNNSGWAKSLGLADGVSISDALAQKEITITDNNTDFSLAYNFVNLTKITLSGINVENLNGLGNAPKLQAIHIENCTIGSLAGLENASKVTYFRALNSKIDNYYAMSSLKSLVKLYIIKPVNKDAEIATLCSDTEGIGKAELTSLNYLGITGSEDYIERISYDYGTGTPYDVTSIAPLANLQQKTKDAVLHLYLQQLQLSSLTGLENFKNVIDIRVDNNNLQTLNGIQNMSNLRYLMANYCYNPTAATSSSLGSAETATANASTDALSYIYKNASGTNASLVYISARSNTSLKYVTYLSTCTNLTQVYLDGCSSISDISSLAAVIPKCGTNYIIPAGMSNQLLSSNMNKIDLKGETITYANLKAIIPKNAAGEYTTNTKLTHLRLRDTVITNNDGSTMSSTELTNALNDILSKCTAMVSLSLRGQSKLTNINFVSSELGLKDLDLLGCSSLNDISLLETLKNDTTKSFTLNSLQIDNASLNLTTIQNVISNLKGSSYWYNYPDSGGAGGLLLSNNGLITKLNQCTNVTYLYMNRGWRGYDGAGISSDWDLSGMTRLTAIDYYGIGGGTVTLPANVTAVSWGWSGGNLDLKNCTKLVSFTMGDKASWSRVDYAITSIPAASMSTLKTVSLRGKDGENCGDLSYLSNLQNFTGAFSFEECNNWTPGLFTNINGLGFLKKASSITINRYTASTNPMAFPDLTGVTATVYLRNFNFSDFTNISTCTSLSSLSLVYTNLSNCNNFSTLSNLTYLNLNCNQLTNIDGLKDLNIRNLYLNTNNISNIKVIDSLKSLKVLDLRNNVIDDIFYYKDADGKSTNKNTQEFLAGLYNANGFNELYITGNNLTDYTTLRSKAWVGKDF